MHATTIHASSESASSRRTLALALGASLATMLALAIAGLLSPSPAHAQQSCMLTDTIDTGVQMAAAEAAAYGAFSDRAENLVMLGVIHDVDRDGTKEFLSAEGAGYQTIRMRNGASGAIIWSFTTPANSRPTQLASIGDITNDNIPEFAIGVRRTNWARGDALFVFNGASRARIASFPSILNGARPKPTTQPETREYPNPQNPSGMSAGVGNTTDGRKLIFFDPNAYGGMGLYLETCYDPINMTSYPCYVEVAPGGGGLIRDFGASVQNLRRADGSTELIVADPNMTFPVVTPSGVEPPNMHLSGGVFRLNSGNLLGTAFASRLGRLRMGHAMANAGDVNGDGNEDYILASPGDGLRELPGSSSVDVVLGGSGVARAYLPAGSVGEEAQFGYSVSGGADLNADGGLDLAVGIPQAFGTGRVHIFTTRENEQSALYKLEVTGGLRFGHSVAVLGQGRVVVRDATSRLYRFTLGADANHNKISDWCEVQPTPVPTVVATTVPQAKLNELHTRLKNAASQTAKIMQSRASRAQLESALKGLRGNVQKIVALMNSYPTELAALSPALGADVALAIKDRETVVQARFKRQARPPRNLPRLRADAVKSLRAVINPATSAASRFATPSRSGR